MPFIGWHFVGKDKNPAKKHLKAEHRAEGSVYISFIRYIVAKMF